MATAGRELSGFVGGATPATGGRIAEWWGTADLLGALEQLGARVVPRE